jgi:hypothetical protein
MSIENFNKFMEYLDTVANVIYEENEARPQKHGKAF